MSESLYRFVKRTRGNYIPGKDVADPGDTAFLNDDLAALMPKSVQKVSAQPSVAVDEVLPDPVESADADILVADPVSPEVAAEPPEPSLPPGNEPVIKTNLNLADSDALILLRGVGAKTAERIIDGRPYNTLQQAKEAASMPEDQWALIEDEITV